MAQQNGTNTYEKELNSRACGGVLHEDLPGSWKLRMPLTKPFNPLLFLGAQCVLLTIKAKDVMNNPHYPLKKTNQTNKENQTP